MRAYMIATLLLVAAGLAFSGYLSAVKLVSNTCAFNEPCPYFLGYPACYYGFAMYLVMFVLTGMWALGKLAPRRAILANIAVSALGTVFSGAFVVQELEASRFTGTLGLSTCLYGFIFYVAILCVSLAAYKKAASHGDV